MPTSSTKTINLALQGGGAHGAFTWGVLEVLLEDGRLDFHTITATSAGALNGAVMATGMLKGGPSAAIALLEKFWKKVSEAGRYGIFSAPNSFQEWMGSAGRMAAQAFAGFEMMSYMFSPYQFNPLAFNPLQNIIAEMVDFPLLQKSETCCLHVCATDVRKSQIKIFSGKQLCIEALLASSCLPQLFQAVEIGGHYYWDGGYLGNPPLFPVVKDAASPDIVIVQIDPIVNNEVPRTGEAIADRLNEINFNSPMLMELRGLEHINRLIRRGHLDPKTSGERELFIHIIGDDEGMAPLSLESKFNPEWDFLNGLRERGKKRAKAWLAAHFDDVGKQSSADLEHLLALDAA